MTATDAHHHHHHHHQKQTAAKITSLSLSGRESEAAADTGKPDEFTGKLESSGSSLRNAGSGGHVPLTKKELLTSYQLTAGGGKTDSSISLTSSSLAGKSTEAVRDGTNNLKKNSNSNNNNNNSSSNNNKNNTSTMLNNHYNTNNNNSSSSSKRVGMASSNAVAFDDLGMGAARLNLEPSVTNGGGSHNHKRATSGAGAESTAATTGAPTSSSTTSHVTSKTVNGILRKGSGPGEEPVSYTHLTLPTIYSV